VLAGVAEEILNLIDEIGRTVQVRTITDSGDPIEPTETPVDLPAQAAIVNATTKDFEGTVIQANDKTGYLSASAAIIKSNRIVDGSIVYRIEALRTINPGDDTLLFIALLRSSK